MMGKTFINEDIVKDLRIESCTYNDIFGNYEVKYSYQVGGKTIVHTHNLPMEYRSVLITQVVKEIQEHILNTLTLGEIEIFKGSRFAYNVYIENIKELTGDSYSDEYELINENIYQHYVSREGGYLLTERTAGTSTSIKALANTFDDVLFIDREAMDKRYNRNVNGKVVFIDEGIVRPRYDGKPDCVYHVCTGNIDALEKEILTGKLEVRESK